MTPDPTESQIRAAIYKALQVVIRPVKGFVFQIETGGRDRRNNRISVGQKGSPDIFLIYQGKPIALEVKTPKGKQSEAQIEFEENIDLAGGYYFIVRSVDEALEILDQLKEGV